MSDQDQEGIRTEAKLIEFLMIDMPPMCAIWLLAALPVVLEGCCSVNGHPCDSYGDMLWLSWGLFIDPVCPDYTNPRHASC